jgi:hypothetical protein
LWVPLSPLTGVLTRVALRGRVTSQISWETFPLLRSMNTLSGSPFGRSSPLQMRTICAWFCPGPVAGMCLTSRGRVGSVTRTIDVPLGSISPVREFIASPAWCPTYVYH